MLVGDLDGDGDVDFGDLDMFLMHWLEGLCEQTDWCEGADLNQSTTVNFRDYAKLAENWLEGVE